MSHDKRIEARKVGIRLEDGSLIRGKINLLAEPGEKPGEFFNRISDLFTKGQNPFIVVFDAVVEGKEDQVVIISKNKILWVHPED